MNDVKSQYTGKVPSVHDYSKVTSTTKSEITSIVEQDARSEFKNKEEEKAAFLATARRNAAIMFAK